MENLTPKLIVPAGHIDMVTTVQFSPNNKYIISGSRDGTVKLWNRKGRLLNTFRQGASVRSACFSNDGSKIFASFDDGYLLKWDFHTLEKIFNNNIKCSGEISIAADGAKILVIGYDTMTIIDAKDGTVLKENMGAQNMGALQKAVFSQDGKKIFTCFSDKVILPFNALTGKHGLPITTGFKNNLTMAIFNNDKKAVVIGEDEYEAYKGVMINLDTEEKQYFSINGIKNEFNAWIKFSHDESQFIASFGHNKKMMAWNSNNLQQVGQTVEQKIDIEYGFYKMAFSSDHALAVGSAGNSSDTVLRIVDTATGELVQKIVGMTSPIEKSKMSADGTRLVALTGGYDLENSRVKVFNLNNELPVQNFKGQQAIGISPDGNWVIFGGKENKVFIYDVNTGKAIDKNIKYHGNKIMDVALSPEKSMAAVGEFENPDSPEKMGHIFDLEKDQLKFSLNTERLVDALSFSNDGKKLLTILRDGNTVFWNTETGQKKDLKLFHEYAGSAVFSSDSESSKILTGGQNGMAILWDAKSGQEIRQFKTKWKDSTEARIESVAFAKNDTRVITGHRQRGFKIWDIATGELLRSFNEHVLGVEGAIHNCFSLTQKGETFVISTAGDHNVHIWDIETGKLKATLYFLGEKDWAVVTPDNLFDASPGGMKMMYFVVGKEVIELDQLKERYWQPGLLPALLNFVNDDVKDVESFKKVALYPTVLSAEIKEEKLEVKIKERSGGIGRTNFFINKKEVIEDANPERKTEFLIDLKKYDNYFAEGENTIAIKCWNKKGWLPSQPYILKYNKKGSGNLEPSLYAIFIGTSKYRNDSLSLNFPDQDAIYLNEAVKIVGGYLFKNKVHTKLLTTELPTSDNFSNKENIKKAFFEIAQKAKPQDVMVIYFTGHGANYDDGQKAQYYYLTHEIVSPNLSDPAVRQQATISSEELTDWINDIPARKQVLIFDTCYAGKILDSLKSKNAIDATRDRAMERMKDRTGTFVLTGSAADKVSYEASNYGQSLLTYTLLHGMKGVALGKLNNQGIETVDVMTLFSYSREEVERLSKEFSVIQKPTLRAPLNVESFAIGLAPKTARAQIKLALPKPVFERSNFMNSENYLDDLDLSEMLDQYLMGNIGIGNRPQAIFIDTINFPGAHNVRGLYKKTENGYEVNGKIYKDHKSLGNFKVEGKGMEDLVPKIAREVENATFNSDDYQVPTDEEIGVLEKGLLNDLKTIKGKPGYGYDENFISNQYKVPLPTLNADQKKDIAKTKDNEVELKYQYYSVVQSKSRKFPFFAACNLHGGQFLKAGRSGAFIRDPRLAKDFQWGDELYTYEFKKGKKYSSFCHRGHMTKREDTQWGKDKPTAIRGAKLTFFFTNAIPQHGHLNGVVWRGLEDYIMHIATNNKTATGTEVYKINIFTGPVFQKSDPFFPIKNGKVQVPTLFWKIVYYRKKSDQQNKLYYVGFLMSQKDLLNQEFWKYNIKAKTVDAQKEKDLFLEYSKKGLYQVKVSFIEEKTKMKFHKAIDPMKNSTKGRQITEVVKGVKKKGVLDESDGLAFGLDGLVL